MNKQTEPVNFLHEISQFIFHSKYARFNETHNRRETWDECVNRVLKMHLQKYKHLSDEDKEQIKQAFQFVKDKKVVPSMRSMQFGGKAVFAANARIFNCAVRHVDSIRSFSEIMYLLLCGCGVGIGCQKYFIDRLPDLVNAEDKTGTVITYVVQDSIEGWADSTEALLSCYFRNNAYSGRKIVFDYSRIRPEGAPIKTGGGKAPGYKGLKASHKKIKTLLDYIIEVNEQSRLKPINAYDVLMHCADAVLSGGIRRSATSIIFDLDDEEMMNAKTFFTAVKHNKFYLNEDTKKWEGKVYLNNKQSYEVELSQFEYDDLVKNLKVSWVHIEPQRARSNNSVLLLRNKTTKADFEKIIKRTREFGEPGFVFGNHPHALLNPCYEINFIPMTTDGICGVQFCNLTSINGAKVTSNDDFYESVKAATIIGTLQAGYTDFKYLSKYAKQLTENEALLGVSITGIMDNPKILLDATFQQIGAEWAVETNKKWAKKLGIKQAARVTCIKPEGTSSLALGSASGIHPHHAHRYFRRIQCNKQETLYKFFKEQNPHMCEPGIWSAHKTDDVVTFPITIPKQSMVKSDLSAIEHLKIIKNTQQNWVNNGVTETNTLPITHNVSCTVIVKDDEWDKVIEYLYNNREYFAAVSLLPLIGDKLFKQAPLEAITTEEDEIKWKGFVEKYKPIDYKELREEQDDTSLLQTASCAGGVCEIF